MRIYIDESGDFGWAVPGLSIQAAVILEDTNDTRTRVLQKLWEWERNIPRALRQNGEVKAFALSDADLLNFAQRVVVGERMVTTFSGFDATKTNRRQFEDFKKSQIALSTPEFMRYVAAGDNRTIQYVKELAHWAARLSDSQWAWLVTLEDVMAGALQRAIVYHLDEDGADLATLRFAIDRSWLRRDRHIRFWRDMLNSRMNGQSTLNPLGLPSDWTPSHPFRKAYDAGSRGGGFDFRRLWQLTEFPDSQADRGVRLADVIAHTARRYFRDGVAREAFELIERETVRGTTLTIVDPAPDAVLSKVLSPLGVR